jgi:mxaJ protein
VPIVSAPGRPAAATEFAFPSKDSAMKRMVAMFGGFLLFCACLVAPALADSGALRVCGDPDNLPFSNQKLEGFENKIADLVARELGTGVSYFWWQHQRGLVRNTFDADQCDVVIGIPKGWDPVLWTKPYYRTAYVMAYRNDKGYKLTSLDAPELKALRIGAYYNTPPQEALAERGIYENLSTNYSLFFDVQGDPVERPAKLMTDLIAGTIDVALPWGPEAGYFAKKLNAPLALVPLEGDSVNPLAFDISMGVKKGNRELKGKLEAVIDRRGADIRKILEDYGIPLVAAHQASQASQATPAGGDAPAANGAGGLKNPFKAADADIVAEGRALFLKNNCAGCHGAGGGGGMGPSLIDDDWKFGSKDEILFRLIKGDIPDQSMPKVYSVLPDDEVWKILAFIRSIYAGDPAKVDW